jgi:hypothetical protein
MVAIKKILTIIHNFEVIVEMKICSHVAICTMLIKFS